MLSKNQTKMQEKVDYRGKLLKSLLDFGLSTEEAQVYLAGLELGPTTVLLLSKASGIPRTTIYAIIDTLHTKGLFKINLAGFKKTYEAENPEKLKLALEQKVESLTNAIPDFLSLYNLKEAESNIRYYENLESIKLLYMDSLSDVRPHDDFLVIANQEQWFNLDQRHFLEYKEKRAKLRIHTRLLLQDSPTSREHKRLERNFNEEVKILPPDTSLNVDFVCTPKRVIIFQTQAPYKAISIENKFVIELYKNLFEIIWKTVE
jgi:sugar-specific transcriptional regulator TrmB